MTISRRRFASALTALTAAGALAACNNEVPVGDGGSPGGGSGGSTEPGSGGSAEPGPGGSTGPGSGGSTGPGSGGSTGPGSGKIKETGGKKQPQHDDDEKSERVPHPGVETLDHAYSRLVKIRTNPTRKAPASTALDRKIITTLPISMLVSVAPVATEMSERLRLTNE